MAEMVVFAIVLGVTLVVSSVSTSLITMALFTNKKFVIGYTKKMMEVVKELQNTEIEY